MKKGKFPNGLADAMDAVGMGPTELGKLIGKERQDVYRWQNGIVRLRPDTAELMAPHLKTTVEALLLLESAQLVPIPLISWISAGALAQPRSVVDPDDVLAHIRQELDQKGDWIALRVEGDSMDRISPPESIILVNRKDKRLVANACYVIANQDTGEATYKRYRPDPARWEPVSTNPTHEPIFLLDGNEPTVVGRVRRSILNM